MMSVPYTISAIAAPFLGYAVDRVGRRAHLSMLAPLLLVIAHTLLGFGGPNIPPLVPMITMGTAYSIFAAALWPSVPLVVRSDAVGMAYGAITCCQNCGLAFLPIVVAAIYSRFSSYVLVPRLGVVRLTLTGTAFLRLPNTLPSAALAAPAFLFVRHSYVYVELFFASISGMGALVGLFLNIVDARPGRLHGALNQPGRAAKVGATTPIVKRRRAARAEAEGTGHAEFKWRLSPAPRKLQNPLAPPPQRTLSSASLSSQA